MNLFVKIQSSRSKDWDDDENHPKDKDNKKWREERKRNRDSKRRYED